MKIKAQISVLLTCLAGVCIVSPQATAGTLSATAVTPTTSTLVNLTTEGTLDWVEWGFGGDPTAFNDKAPGGGPINYKQIGDLTQAINAYSPTGVPVLWDNGAPTLSASDDQEGIYVGFQGGNGFQITVQADTMTRFLKIYAGCYGEQLHLHAALSDASAPAYDDYSLTDPTESSVTGVYTIKFAAASSGQTLAVTLSVGTNVFDTNYANTTLQAATLFGQAPAFAANQPASQTNWLGSSAQLTAQASGDPSIPLSYQWWVEAKGAFVPLADGGQISGSGTPALTISNLSLANGTNYYVIVTNAYGAATSSVAALTVLPVTGTLLGDAAPAPASVNLTALGTLDWAAWGVASGNPPNYLEQKAGGTNQISDITLIGPAPNGPATYNNALVAYSWSDGTPDASISATTTGVYFNSLKNGYQFTVPADKTNKILTVYAGGWNCQVQLEASLSDSSAPPYVSPALTCSTAQAADAYTIDFAAGSPGQTLTVSVYCLTDGGNCTLMAATLQEAPVSLQFGFAGSSLRLTWPSGALQQTTNLAGPWITTSATSPFNVTPSPATPQMYYRVKVHY